MTTPAPDRCGWLKKRGNLVRNWQRRWFVLHDTELKYYKSDQPNQKEQGQITLDGCSVDIAPESKYNCKFCFELNSPHQSRVYVIVAENGTALQDWMNSIRRAMLKIRRVKSQAENDKRRKGLAADDASLGTKTGSSPGGHQRAHSSQSPTANTNTDEGLPSAASAVHAARPSAPTGDILGTSMGSTTSGTSTPGGTTPTGRANPALGRLSTGGSDNAPPPLNFETTRPKSTSNSGGDSKHKYDVYLKWLNETKDGNRTGTRPPSGMNTDDGVAGIGGGTSVLHRRLLEAENEEQQPGCCVTMQSKCVIL